MEVFRYMRQSGFGPVKNADEDVKIGKYTVPAGVIEMFRSLLLFRKTFYAGNVFKVDIYPNADFMMNDERHWKNPRSFRPERFLNENGILGNKVMLEN